MKKINRVGIEQLVAVAQFLENESQTRELNIFEDCIINCYGTTYKVEVSLEIDTNNNIYSLKILNCEEI